jgi:hypothetical protein
MKIIAAGPIFILNYKIPRSSKNQVNLYEFFFLGASFQTKF